MRLRAHRFAFLIPAFACALPVHAQVLEIGADGDASWVTGNMAGISLSSTNSTAPAEDVPDDIAESLPPLVIGNVQRSSARVPAAYAAHINILARRYDLSPALLEALVWQESRWRENAVSPAGARGLAQLMPGTARDLGVDPNDPFANLEGGARYLRTQLNRFDGNLELALAAYNAGPARVARSGGIPRIRETQDYVAAIMRRLATHSQDIR